MPFVVPILASTKMDMASVLSTATMMAAPHASLVTLLFQSVPSQRAAAVGGLASAALPI